MYFVHCLALKATGQIHNT